MNSSNTLLAFFLATTIVLAISLPQQLHAITLDEGKDSNSNEVIDSSLSGKSRSRFLAYRPWAVTCDKYPTVCRAKGSSGPYCCNKQCVNVMTDKLNCGRCGRKCRYSEMCCEGECVNAYVNEKHCGRCHNKCKRGSSCVYGLCSYA